MVSFLKSNNALVIAHAILLYVLYLLLYQLGIVSADFNNENLMNRDAVWYLSIVENGYLFIEGQQSNTAFFPLFSGIWSLLQLSPVFISLVNTIAYLTGVLILIKTLEIEKYDLLMIITTPTIVFCFIPYSEAFFFLSASIMLLGLKKDKLWLIFLGCLFAGLTRSVVVLFIPSALLIYLYNFKSVGREKMMTFVLIAASLLSFLIVMFILYLYTGIWDSFFESQKEWGHELKVPSLPFYSLRRETLWEDLIAITIAAGLGITSVVLFIKRFTSKSVNLVRPEVLFSLLYLTGAGLVIFLFQGGDFHSLNRYMFSTPFFLVICVNVKKLDFQLPKWFWIGLVLVLLLFFSSNSLFVEKLDLVKSSIYAIVILLLMLRWVYWLLDKKTVFFKILMIVIGIGMQIHLLHTYLSGDWIG